MLNLDYILGGDGVDVGLGTKTNSGVKDVIKALEDVIDDKEWYNVRFYLHC